MASPSNPPPGWYPDPHSTGSERYWSGAFWTEMHRPVSPSTSNWPAPTPAPRTRRLITSPWMWIAVVVIAALGVTLAVRTIRSSGDDRWSALPHSAICTPTPWANGNLRDPTSDIVFAPVPDELRVRRVTLTHLGGQKLRVAVEFLQSPPTAPIPVSQGGRLTDPPGSVSYDILIFTLGEDRETVRGILTVDSPRRGSGWKSGSFGEPGFELRNPDSVLSSVETSGNTVTITLDLQGQDAYFGGEVFKPDVSILVSGVGRRTSIAPQGEFITFENQECPWNQQAASQPTPGTASPGGPPMPPATRPPDGQTLPANAAGFVYIETRSGKTRCQISVGNVGCESAFTNSPVIGGERATGVEVSASGSNRWVVGNLGAIPTTTIGYATYRAVGWTIEADRNGTRFTNTGTGHGMFVSTDQVNFF